MKEKKQLIRILIGAAFFIAGKVIQVSATYQMLLFLLGYIIVGSDILWKAIRNISRGQVFDENFLMSVATIGAVFIGEYPEAVGVMLFYQVGELFQSYAVKKSRRSITSLMDIRPDYANLRRNGELVKVDPEEVAVGDIIVVKPGERIPLDGKVTEGSSMLDTSALTGESVPRRIEEGHEVLSGCINLNSMLTIVVEKGFEESTVSKILDLVENASSKKAKTENFITKFARYYTPTVVFLALALAILPPLVTGDSFGGWIYRALVFLVISCPCALVISIPLSFFGGIGGASKCGVLVKGSNYLEALADTEIVVFDKTGTLTKGNFQVTKIHPVGRSEEALLEVAAYAESYSNHPISLSVKKAYGKELEESRVQNAEEISGHGVKVTLDGQTVYAGNRKLMQRAGIDCPVAETMGTVVYVAINKVFAGYLVIADEVKADAAMAMKELKANGVRKTVMLTGDGKKVAKDVADQLGVDLVYAELLPADKVERMEELLEQKSNRGKLAFVGDGINDAPVLARADIGIAMGGLGSDAAIEAADVVIMTDEPSKLATVMKVSRKTLRIVKENIVLALGVKAIVLVLGALGMADMWGAVFADVGVSVIAILNAIRILNVKRFESNSRYEPVKTV